MYVLRITGLKEFRSREAEWWEERKGTTGRGALGHTIWRAVRHVEENERATPQPLSSLWTLCGLEDMIQISVKEP